MRWARDVIAPLLVAWTPQHALCFSGGKQRLSSAAPSVGARWCSRRLAGSRQCFGRSWSSTAATRQRRRSSSTIQHDHDQEEHREPPRCGLTTTMTASSVEGDATKKRTRYTIDVGVHPDVAEIAVKHSVQLPRFLEKYPISSHTQEAYAQAVEFVRNFHYAAGNGDTAGMISRQYQQGGQDKKAGEEASCVQQQQQPQQQQGPLPVVLDSGCGTGRSSALLARSYPHLPVIGIDRSAVRLSKGGGGRRDRQPDGSRPHTQAERRGDDKEEDINGDVDNGNVPLARGGRGGRRREPLPGNLLLLRADLVDLWILASRDSAWQVREHSILYPNPYPKRSQLRSRWHGHSVFPVLLGLGGRITLRSNWKSYLDEFCLAVLAVNAKAENAKGQGNPSAVQQREGYGGGEGEPFLEGNVNAGDFPASVAAAAASYVVSAKAGPLLFVPTVPAATNFEAKYVAVGEPVYELLLEPRLPQ